MNKPIKVIITVLSIMSLLIVGLFMVLANNGRSQSIPVRQGIDAMLKDEVFKLSSEDPHTDLSKLFIIEQDGTTTYDWQTIGELLQKADMDVMDYVVLLQLVRNMTDIRFDGAKIPNCEALTELVRLGYSQGLMTSTLANLCNLYKDWVETVLVASNSRILFMANLSAEVKASEAQFELEMMKASILDRLVTEDTQRRQSKKWNSAEIPEIAIFPGEMSQYNYQPYIIQIGNRQIVVFPFTTIPGDKIHNVLTKMEQTLIEDREQNRISQSEINRRVNQIKDTYTFEQTIESLAIGSVVSVSDDDTITMVSCFNETELQIRVHCYNHDMKEKYPEHQDISVGWIKSEFVKEYGSNILDNYIKWYYGMYHNQRNDYRWQIEDIYDSYKFAHANFAHVKFYDLTPEQIDKLVKKKEKGDSYILDLGNVP